MGGASATADLLLRFLQWYLVDSLWIGAAIALGYALFERLAPRAPASLRYLLACVALLAVALVPAGMAAWRVAGDPVAGPLAGEYLRIDLSGSGSDSWVERGEPVRLGDARWQSQVRDFAPLAVAAWGVGVCLMAIRYALVWRVVRRWCRIDTLAAPPAMLALLDSVRERMGVSHNVRLLLSHRAEVPMVVGWARVVLLLPAAVALNMEAEHLEAIMAHELAHVRRHDWLVNLMQVFAGTLLYHHPAVWWLNARIAAEREFCCDDLAVRASGGVASYLHALLRLEELRAGDGASASSSPLALAATDGSLVRRARRLMDEHTASAPGAPASALAMAVVVCALAGWLALLGPSALRRFDAARQLRDLRSQNRRIAGQLEEETARRLEKPITLKMGPTALRNVLQAIGRESGLQIVYPLERGLEWVSLEAKDEEAWSVLERLLEPRDLVWVHRGDLALQVLPVDGSIDPRHKLFRVAVAKPVASGLQPLAGEMLRALTSEMASSRFAWLSEPSQDRVVEAMRGLTPTAPTHRVTLSRAIAQVERAPELESDVSLTLELTGGESAPDAAERWVEQISRDEALLALLAGPPRLLLAPRLGPNTTREFSIVLPLSLPRS